MLSDPDDDAQAEKQVQTSLQCAATESTGSRRVEGWGEQTLASVNAAEEPVKHAAAGVVPVQSPSSAPVSGLPSPPHHHCELARPSEHADVFQPFKRERGGPGALQEDDVLVIREFPGKKQRMSASAPAFSVSEGDLGVARFPTSSRFGTRESDRHSGQDVRMVDAGSPALEVSHTASETALATTSILLGAYKGTQFSNLTNQWSKPASLDGSHHGPSLMNGFVDQDQTTIGQNTRCLNETLGSVGGTISISPRRRFSVSTVDTFSSSEEDRAEEQDPNPSDKMQIDLTDPSGVYGIASSSTDQAQTSTAGLVLGQSKAGTSNPGSNQTKNALLRTKQALVQKSNKQRTKQKNQSKKLSKQRSKQRRRARREARKRKQEMKRQKEISQREKKHHASKSMPRSSSDVSPQRTRAGLASLLKSVEVPEQRVNAICGYLSLPGPDYLVREHPHGQQWSARFPTKERLLRGAIQVVLPATTLDDAEGKQACASLVEQMLFENIYSGQIPLGDGDATFPDPALDVGTFGQMIARVPRKAKRICEKDEGLTLEEINRRLELPDRTRPRPARSMPLAASKWPPTEVSRLENDTPQNELPSSPIVLSDNDDKRLRSPRFSPRANRKLRIKKSKNRSLPSSHPACRSTRSASVSPPYHAPAPHFQRQRRRTTNPHLLPSGQHRYVSPPPFLDTSLRPLGIRPDIGNAEVGRDARAEEEDDDEEIVFLGERTVEDVG